MLLFKNLMIATKIQRSWEKVEEAGRWVLEVLQKVENSA
jgi:hypothetical protein